LSEEAARPRARRSGSGVTLFDVARHAGLSHQTVSRVINGAKNVQDKNRSAVEDAIKQLNYRPNLLARRLAHGAFPKIGILFESPANAFMGEFLVGAFRKAHASNAQLLIEQCDTNDVGNALRKFEDQGITGIVLAPSLIESNVIADFMAASRTPLVFVASRGMKGHGAVRIDDDQAAYDMTMRLVALGHRRIGFITGSKSHGSSDDRLAGYKRALQAMAIPVDSQIIRQGDYTYASALPATEALLDLEVPPTAIFASNDDMAAAVISAGHRRGLVIPRDLSVAGVDDTRIASMLSPALTTIRQPISDFATLALDRLLREDGPAAGTDLIVPHQLVERESTCALVS
jgi:LacI family transcriptional regulator